MKFYCADGHPPRGALRHTGQSSEVVPSVWGEWIFLSARSGRCCCRSASDYYAHCLPPPPSAPSICSGSARAPSLSPPPSSSSSG